MAHDRVHACTGASQPALLAAGRWCRHSTFADRSDHCRVSDGLAAREAVLLVAAIRGSGQNSFARILSDCGKKSFNIFTGFRRNDYVRCVEDAWCANLYTLSGCVTDYGDRAASS